MQHLTIQTMLLLSLSSMAYNTSLVQFSVEPYRGWGLIPPLEQSLWIYHWRVISLVKHVSQ